MNEADMTCTCCENSQHDKGRPRRILKLLPKKTSKRKVPVFACTFCDGPMYDLATINSKKAG